MTVPTGSKTQDRTEEEQQYESPPNVEEEDNSQPPTDTLPSQPIIPPIFSFRTNFRNIYINPITNPSTIPPNRDNNKDENEFSQPPRPKLDEFCIQWCKQKDLNRDKSIIPECKMLCFRRINSQSKNDLLTKPVVKESLKHHNNKHEVENVAQVLYNKDGIGEDKVSRNFLDGYYLYYVKGLELCQKHTKGMKNDEILNRSAWAQNNPEEYEIDLGENFEKTKSETKRIVKRAFTPGYQFAKRYLESWSDGTQSSFFKRFYESVQRMDAVHIMQDNVKKAIEVWVDDGSDNGEPNGNNGNNNGNDKNDKN